MNRLARAVAGIEASTPSDRDRSIDALRAFAILGVIVGHWMVTALVLEGPDRLRSLSPLIYLPGLIPVSWLFQTLAVFFFVGGYTGARSLSSARRSRLGYPRWLRNRLSRLLRPLILLPLVWVPLELVLRAIGFAPSTLRVLGKMAVAPLWFLLVYVLLTAVTPLMLSLRDRLGRAAPLLPLGAVLAVDAARFAGGAPEWIGWINAVACWMVPFSLGVLWAGGAGARGARPVRWPTGWLLLIGGIGSAVALVAWFGYPSSMVGIPGARISNLSPPTLAATAFGVGQVGLALLVRESLARWMRRPWAWAGVAVVNLSAMTVFLWHQTAMICVTLVALIIPIRAVPGLHTMPDTASWVLWRLAWVPAFAVTLMALTLVLRRWERAPRGQGTPR
jgi:hypothetical protein